MRGDIIKNWLAGAKIRSIHTCSKKIRYGHMATAKSAVDAMHAKGSKDLEAYKCKVCKGFHVGHSRRVLIAIALANHEESGKIGLKTCHEP